MATGNQAPFTRQELLRMELFSRCITAEGKDFTIRRVLGTYRQHFIRTEDGWQCDSRSDASHIHAITGQIRQFAAMYPELTVTYPHTVLSDPRAETDKDEAWVDSEAIALISVPADFAARHGGEHFLSVLQEGWQEQLTGLAIAAQQRLLRHEIRTRQMFGEDPSVISAVIFVGTESVFSEIWEIPLEKAGLHHLRWDEEVCGMARALALKLAELLPCETVLRREYERSQREAYAIHLTIKETSS